MTAAIRFDQVGIPASTGPGARTDGIPSGGRVTVRNDSGLPCRVELAWYDPSDSGIAATLAQDAPDQWRFDPTAAISGSIKVRMIEAEGTAGETVDEKIFGIRLTASSLLIPALNERGDPEVDFTDTTDRKAIAAAASDNNEAFLGLKWLAWWPALRALFLKVEELVATISGGGTAPPTQYVNADTGNDNNDGLTALTALATLTKAIERIGSKNGDCLINLNGADGTEYDVAALGKPRPGFGQTTIYGQVRTYELSRSVASIVGRVVTITGAPLNPGEWRGWLADPGAGMIAIEDNDATTITLTFDHPNPSATSITAFRPGIRLRNSSARNPICGGLNASWLFEYLTLAYVELAENTNLLTGNLNLVSVTAKPGCPVEISRAWVHTDPTCGISMRADSSTGPSSLRLSEVSGTMLGYFGTCSARVCGFDANSEQLYLAGACMSLTDYGSRLFLGVGWSFACDTVGQQSGSTITLGPLFTSNPSATFGQAEYSTTYCQADYSAFVGVDMSVVGNSFDVNGNHVERI